MIQAAFVAQTMSNRPIGRKCKFAAGGVIEIVFVDNNNSVKKYQDVLADNLLRVFSLIISEDWVFYQDNMSANIQNSIRC